MIRGAYKLLVSVFVMAGVFPTQAALIAHYDFSDGDLLDNEVGEQYTLRSMKSSESSLAEVQLDRLEGTAVFPVNSAQSPWLEADGPGFLENFTVSFWFCTDQVLQGSHYAGLFSSDTDAGDGNWMVYSGRHLGGALDFLGVRESAVLPPKPHAPNIWQHVVVRRIGGNQPRHELYITSLNDEPAGPVAVHIGYNSTFKKFVLGNNHRVRRGYRMELANVKIFDDSNVSVDSLFKEGPCVRRFNAVSFFSTKRTLRMLNDEADRLRDELKNLPQLDVLPALEAYGYHSDYLPVLADGPREPRWVVEIGVLLGHSFNELYLVPAVDRRVPDMPGYGFPKRFRLVSINKDGHEEILADWRDRDYPDPGRFPVRFAGTDSSLQKIILEVYRGVVDGDREFFALDEVIVRAAKFVIKTQSVKASGSFESLPFWSTNFLTDQRTNLGLPVRPAAAQEVSHQDFIWKFPQAYTGRLAVDIDLKENRKVNVISLLPARPPEGIVIPGYGFPEAVELLMYTVTDEGKQPVVRRVERQEVSNPGNNAVRLSGYSQLTRRLRLIFDRFPKHKGIITFALGEIDVQGQGKSIGLDAKVSMMLLPSNQDVADEGSLKLLNDGLAGGDKVIPLISWLDGLTQAKLVSQRLFQAETLQNRLRLRWERNWKLVRKICMAIAGGFLCSVAVIALMLRQRSAQKMLLRVEQEHRQTELEQMKIRFFTHISHELRTPLTLILGPLEKALGRVGDADQEKLLSLAHRNVKKLQVLVDQLLDFRKLQDGRLGLKWSTVELGRFVQNGFDIYQSMAADRKISYRLVLFGKTGRVVLDAGKFQSIMDNLISNALKYTHEGGCVTVEAGASKEQILFAVEDTGVGIAAADSPYVFDQYFRADGVEAIPAKGSGIGLAYVKGLVDLWGGEITVKSPVTADKGARFLVKLPAESRMLDAESGAECEGNDTPEKEFETLSTSFCPLSSILIVEDSKDIRAFIRAELEGEYCVLEAENGREGLKLAAEQQPDLVLSDVMMPEMNGIELCRRLKRNEKTSHLPVIMLTARGSDGHQLEGLQTGADDYISKPFSMPILLARIHNLLEARRKMRERFSQEIFTIEPSEITVTSADEEFLQRAIAVVEKHMDDFDFSVEVFTAELHVSRTALYMKLKSLVGQTPQEFIRILRLKRGAQLLRSCLENISEIAARVGFLEPTNFSRSFKSQFGMSPSEYRKSDA